MLERLTDRHYTLEKGRMAWTGSSMDIAANIDLVHRHVGI